MANFQWINTELSEIDNYVSRHFTECTKYAETYCPPITSSCAYTLCANCPSYYPTCCLSATNALSCFRSIDGLVQVTPTSFAAAVTTSTPIVASVAATTAGSNSGTITPGPTLIASTSNVETTAAPATAPASTTTAKSSNAGKKKTTMGMLVTFGIIALLLV